MILYGFKFGPFFDPSIVPVYIKEDKKTKYILDRPFHNCLQNPIAIRNEVTNLTNDFNMRLKNLLFSSARCAYICCITPIIFAPKQLYFDVPWVIQHVLLFWLGRLCAYFTQIYPVK